MNASLNMAGPITSIPTVQQRLIELLRYIEHVERLNRRPAFTVPEEFFCCHEADLRCLPEVECGPAGEGEEEIWLRVPRLNRKDPPKPSSFLKPWMILAADPGQEPQLRDEITIEEEGEPRVEERRKRPDQAQIEAEFEAYLKEAWQPWAVSEKPRRKTMAVYQALFSLTNQAPGRGPEEHPLEVVWGTGVAVWKHPSGQTVRHPLITQPVEVGLDPSTQAMTVYPRRRPPTLEIDPYAELEIPGVGAVEGMWKGSVERLEEELTPFEEGSFAAMLKAAAGHLDPEGAYVQRSEPQSTQLPEAREHLIITDTWVLFARPRSPNYLFEDLRRLQSRLERVDSVPAGPAALVSPLSDTVTQRPRVCFRGLSYLSGRTPSGASVQELYFPKPYNDEQVSIIEKLEQSPGVVVQGPPGTGKTHTIGNVICHYLATGRRILVTSKKEPALAVLRGQIPAAVRPLSVALLTDEKDGMRQFEHSIQTISEKLSQLRPEELEVQIQSLGRRVDDLHMRLANVDAGIEQWARKHLERLRFGEREMLPEELARLVLEQEGQHTWFPDKLPGGLQDPSVTDADVAALRQGRRQLGADLAYVDVRLPLVEALPDPETIAEYHEGLIQARGLEEAVAHHNRALDLRSEDPAVLDAAGTLMDTLTEALRLHDSIQAGQLAGWEALHRGYLQGVTGALQTLDELLEEYQRLDEQRLAFMRRPVEIPQGADLDAGFREAVERCSKGRSALGLLGFGRNTLKEQLARVRVTAQRADGPEAWSHVLAYLQFCDAVRGFLTRWNVLAQELQQPEVDGSTVQHLRSLKDPVQSIRSVRTLALGHSERICSLCGQVFRKLVPGPAVTLRRAAMQEMHQALERQIQRAQLRETADAVAECLQVLAPCSGAVVAAMRRFLEEDLGKGTMDRAAAARQWSVHWNELRRIVSLTPLLEEVRRGCSRVEEAGAPQWAKRLRTEPSAADDPWTPPTWLDSWRWHQANALLEEIDGRTELRRLQAQRKTIESDLARAYEELVDRKTWLAVIRTSTPAVKAALQKYQDAIRRIGKGQGIRAARYRRDAREAMNSALPAVPCWIMPQFRVSETLPAEIGTFDLVIVDEASQSDLWALPCLLRGTKILVVGDEKQVSPEAIGLKEDRVKDLHHRFLVSQAHGSQMTPERSLYDLARVVFAGEMVMLREHFRCVAPIIEFSRREFYNSEIRPLRVPKGSERLDPPLIDVRVLGGSRSGKDNKVNEAEARAIVAEMKTLLADPRHASRTMGVVSLLGNEQARRIHELISWNIDPHAIEAHRIDVGDARTFQGEERDIMFLSMVATKEAHTPATSQMFEQRFNVAASRARDRMYLFRSVDASDLKPDDLKTRLIEHFRTPFRQNPRQVASLRELCESQFEREMFDELTQGGYRVQPQVSAGQYRIDFVVSGDEDRRLAVECDGDKFHGPEHWNRDAARQRTLERAGWTFWRCFGSSFYRSRAAVLEDLVSTLEKMGITPIGPGDPDLLGRYTEHREVNPWELQLNLSTSPGALEEQAQGDPGRKEGAQKAPRQRRPAKKVSDPSAPPKEEKDEGSPSRKAPSEEKKDINPPPVLPEYSDAALEAFLAQHGLRSEDKRQANGALWVYGAVTAAAQHQLEQWGFRYASGRQGWWRKGGS